jgi:hypothetical protein
MALAAGVGFLTLGFPRGACFTLATEILALPAREDFAGRSFPACFARIARHAPVDDLFPQRRPITVAGPWPNFTAFPFPRPAQFSIAVYAAWHATVKFVARNEAKLKPSAKPGAW